MQKTIRILAIIAMILTLVSLFAMLICIAFQPALGRIFTKDAEVLGALPVFPTSQFVTTMVRLFLLALLIICAGNKRGGIWLELVLFVFVVVVLPFINNGISTAVATWVSRSKGAVHMSAHSIASQITNYCMTPGNWGQALGCMVCGMSIVFKRMNKKMAKQQKV